MVAPRHYRMRLHAPHIAATARAGHFVHVLPRPQSLLDPLLRRAFSVLAVQGEAIDILYRVEGKGTLALSGLAPGAQVDLLGPLGQPFVPMPARAILVGGGVGVPPMAMLAAQRGPAPHDGAECVALIGARSAAELICLDDFARYDVPVEIATDDGSRGHHGRVTELLLPHLEKAQGAPPTVYACGPLPMLGAVSSLCQRFLAPCQVSLEENMPCGIGVCNGCVAPVVGAGDDYGRYRRICVEGPVVWAHDVDWSHFKPSCPA